MTEGPKVWTMTIITLYHNYATQSKWILYIFHALMTWHSSPQPLLLFTFTSLFGQEYVIFCWNCNMIIIQKPYLSLANKKSFSLKICTSQPSDIQWIGSVGKILTGNPRFSSISIESEAFRFQLSLKPIHWTMEYYGNTMDILWIY